jgi:molecular chaperone HscB
MSSILQQNYFELFGLVPEYKIDSAVLASRYRGLQQSVHPDRFAAASEQERRLSVQSAAHVNEAFQTLKHPLSRARYLLELRGISADQANALDEAFLLEQMNLREQLDDLPTQVEPLLALMQMREALEARITELQQVFVDSLNGDNNTQALQVFNKMQFFYRLQEELDGREEQLSA